MHYLLFLSRLSKNNGTHSPPFVHWGKQNLKPINLSSGLVWMIGSPCERANPRRCADFEKRENCSGRAIFWAKCVLRIVFGLCCFRFICQREEGPGAIIQFIILSLLEMKAWNFSPFDFCSPQWTNRSRVYEKIWHFGGYESMQFQSIR